MQVCVRCQSSLQLGAVAIEPPRASRFRLANRLLSVWYVIWDRIRNHYGVILIGRTLARARTLDLTPSSFIPGVYWYRQGHRILGVASILVWLAALFMTLVYAGLDVGQWWLTLAIGLHAVCLAYAIRVASFGMMGGPLVGLAMFLVLRIVIYGGLLRLAGQFYTPLQLDGLISSTSLRNGDIVLYRGPWLRRETPRRGDIVVYRIHATNVGNYHAYVGEGFGIDRVVGVPGDHVAIVKGALQVNGKPVADNMGPLGRFPLTDFKQPAGPADFVIFPSSLELTMHGNVGLDLLGTLSVVHGSDIGGRIVYRVQPWSRRGRL